jgi:predicted PurR-regulated permease PerM
MATSARSRELERYAVISGLVLLGVGCYLVIRPFVTAFLWGAILAVSTWAAYGRLLRRLGNRKGLAAALMVAGLSALLLVPLVALALRLAAEWPGSLERFRGFVSSGALRHPPDWVLGLPLVGRSVANYWESVAVDPRQLAEDLRPLLGPVRGFLVTFSAGLGGGLLEFALALLVAGYLYIDGESLGAALHQVAARLGGETAGRQVAVIASTVRGVFNGVVGTALVQGLLAAVGFALAGVPGVFLGGVLTALLSVIPGGPMLLWLPAAVWLNANHGSGWAVFMLLWGTLAIGGADNVIRPLLIGKSVAAPLPLVFLGVVGGILAFGFLGLFIGPTLLAIAYNLFQDWMAEQESV